MAKAYLIFHLNLAFSSIEEELRPALIERCYWPLLKLIKRLGIPAGVELTGWTLQEINHLDSVWVKYLADMLKDGDCDLIGSGWSQMIGPLAPAKVNRWNQKLGLLAYKEYLNCSPKIALVNEMAYSSGMVDIYTNAGYQGIVMDRDNVRLALKNELKNPSMPNYAKGMEGHVLPIIWADSILFQRLQRAVHGEISSKEYVDYVRARISSGEQALPIYSNDVEVFDFRPGRFEAESELHPEGEWNRLENILKTLKSDLAFEWVSPNQLLREMLSSDRYLAGFLSSVTYPVPVKKQAKYNLARWAVTGRNDVWLNTICHRIAKKLNDSSDIADWKILCELWASDLRTHITLDRWNKSTNVLRLMCAKLGISSEFEYEKISKKEAPISNLNGLKNSSESIFLEDDGMYLKLESEQLNLILNLRRGLCIKELTFKRVSENPLIGTIPHGYFDSINYGADFYSGTTVAELVSDRVRVTDLCQVEPSIVETLNEWIISSVVTTKLGEIHKRYTIPKKDSYINVSVRLKDWKRPAGVIRVSAMTLLPGAFDEHAKIITINGGVSQEVFGLKYDCDHSIPSSTFVSCNSGFGASEGWIAIADSSKSVEFKWDPAKSAIFPMLVNKRVEPAALTRLIFSMSELDDTSKPDGILPEFDLRISARRSNFK